MAEDQVRSISRWAGIRAGLIVDRSEAVIICRKRGQDVISPVLYRVEDRVHEEESQETRKKFHLANPRYLYSTFGKRVTCDSSAIRYLTPLSISDVSISSSLGWYSLLSPMAIYLSILLTLSSLLLLRRDLSFPRLRNDRQLTKLSSYQIDSWRER